MRWAESPARDDEAAAVLDSPVYGSPDLRYIVPDDNDLLHHEPEGLEALDYPLCIGVEYNAIEYLVADGYYGDLVYQLVIWFRVGVKGFLDSDEASNLG